MEEEVDPTWYSLADSPIDNNGPLRTDFRIKATTYQAWPERKSSTLMNRGKSRLPRLRDYL